MSLARSLPVATICMLSRTFANAHSAKTASSARHLTFSPCAVGLEIQDPNKLILVWHKSQYALPFEFLNIAPLPAPNDITGP